MKLNETYDEYILKKTAREASKDFKAYTRSVLEQVAKEKSLTPRKVRKIVEKEKIDLKRMPILVDTCIATSAIANYASQNDADRKSAAAKPVRQKINAIAKLVPELDVKNPKQFVDTSYGIRAAFSKKELGQLLVEPVDSKKYQPQVLQSFDRFLDSVTPNRLNIMKQAIKHTNAQLQNYKKDFGYNIMANYIEKISDGYSKKDAIAVITSEMGAQTDVQTIRFMETEMHGVYEESKIRNAESNGYKYKYWRTARDVKVRDTHRRLDGRIVKNDETFKVGKGEGLYPGDPNLPLEERINCRCSTEFGFVPRGTRQGPNIPIKQIPREVQDTLPSIPLANINTWIPMKNGEEEDLWREKDGTDRKKPIRKWTQLFNRKNKDEKVAKLYEKIPSLERIGRTRRNRKSRNRNIDTEYFNCSIEESDGVYSSAVGRELDAPNFYLKLSGEGFDYAPETNTRVITHELAHHIEGQMLQLTGFQHRTHLGNTVEYGGNAFLGSGLYQHIQNNSFRGVNKHSLLFDHGITKPIRDEMPNFDLETIDNLNPTGGVFVDYRPEDRARAPLAPNITSLDITMGRSAEEMITIYRGTVPGQTEINPGDFITTNFELAKSYTGEGDTFNVISMEVPLRHVLDDFDEPLGEEYIYRPNPLSLESRTMFNLYDSSERLSDSRNKPWQSIKDNVWEEVDRRRDIYLPQNRRVTDAERDRIFEDYLETDIKKRIGEDTFRNIKEANVGFNQLRKEKRKIFKHYEMESFTGKINSGRANELFRAESKKMERKFLVENDNLRLDGYHWEDLRATGSFLDALHEGNVQVRLKISGHGTQYHIRPGNPEAELFANYMSIKSTAPELADVLKNAYPEVVEELETMQDVYLEFAENHVERFTQKRWEGMELEDVVTNKRMDEFTDIRDLTTFVRP